MSEHLGEGCLSVCLSVYLHVVTASVHLHAVFVGWVILCLCACVCEASEGVLCVCAHICRCIYNQQLCFNFPFPPEYKNLFFPHVLGTNPPVFMLLPSMHKSPLIKQMLIHAKL